MTYSPSLASVRNVSWQDVIKKNSGQNGPVLPKSCSVCKVPISNGTRTCESEECITAYKIRVDKQIATRRAAKLAKTLAKAHDVCSCGRKIITHYKTFPSYCSMACWQNSFNKPRL